MVDRVPPQALEYEYAVIAACIDTPEVIDTLKGVLEPCMFYRSETASIYKMLISMREDGAAIDVLSVSDRARKAGDIDAHRVQLAWLTGRERMASSRNALYYASQVREAWIKRRLLATCRAVQNRAENASVAELVAMLRSDLERLNDGIDEPEPSLAELCDRLMSEWDNPPAKIPFTIASFNGEREYLRRGELWIIGASPSVGKTAALTQLAVSVAKAGYRALFASYEMSALSVYARMLSQLTGLPMFAVLEPRDKADSDAVVAAMQELSRLGVMISKPKTSSVHALVSMIEREKPDSVFVDYLQLLEGEGDTRVQQVGNVAQELKAEALRANAVVVAASQLSRAAFVERGDRPELHHLRESGEIEAIADVIALVWRDRNEQVIDGHYAVRHVRIAKNRNGPVRETGVRFNLRCARWEPSENPFE